MDTPFVFLTLSLLVVLSLGCEKKVSPPGFSASALSSELEKRKPALAECYEGEHPLNFDMTAIIDGETGALTHIRVVGEKNVGDCIVSKLQAWRFDPKPYDTPFNLPIYFERTKAAFDPQPTLANAKERFVKCVSPEVGTFSLRFHLTEGTVVEAVVSDGPSNKTSVTCLENVAKTLSFPGSGERRFVTKVSLFD